MYAATKKATELMAHTYSHLFGIPTTGLRFFTVYGPRGRPDMALFLFTEAILAGRPIDVFNEGRMQRDFTYIDDIVEGVVRVLDRPAAARPGRGRRTRPIPRRAPRRTASTTSGTTNPVELLQFIGAIEDAIGRKAVLNLLPMQPGDVPATYADVDDLVRDVGFAPNTPIEVGVARFVEWYREYYGVPQRADAQYAASASDSASAGCTSSESTMSTTFRLFVTATATTEISSAALRPTTEPPSTTPVAGSERIFTKPRVSPLMSAFGFDGERHLGDAQLPAGRERLGLGDADVGDLGVGEDRGRRLVVVEVTVGARGEAHHVLGDLAALHRRDRRQRQPAREVAGGVDVRHVRLAVAVAGHEPALVDLDARGTRSRVRRCSG